MKRHNLLFISLILLLVPALAHSQSRSQIEDLSASIEKDLIEGILPFWINHTVDPDGGFYGTVMKSICYKINIAAVTSVTACRTAFINVFFTSPCDHAVSAFA